MVAKPSVSAPSDTVTYWGARRCRISLAFQVAAALAATVLAPCAPADEATSGSVDVFQFGVRAVYLQPDNPVFPGAPSMSGNWYPEFSGDWRLTRSWSTEVSVGLPANYNLPGTGSIGIRLMPFTWTAKYHFLLDSRLRPYLGVGAHYTRATFTNIPPGTFATNNVGFVAQAGVELQAGSTLSVNADIRRLFRLEPNDTRIDPFLYGLGITFHY